MNANLLTRYLIKRTPKIVSASLIALTLGLSPILVGGAISPNNPITVDYKKPRNQGDIVSFGTGGPHELKIKAKDLIDVRVVSAGSLIFMLPDDAYFSMETVSENDYDFDNIDMSVYPELLLGLRTPSQDASAFEHELYNSYKHVIKRQIAPSEIRIFQVPGGKGYWALGAEKSVIVISSDEVGDQYEYFYIRNMSESDIRRLIINGLL